MKCEKCKQEHDGSYGSGRFCSAKCARSFSTSKDIKKIKIVNCITCNKEIEVDKRASDKHCKCDDCRGFIKLSNGKIKNKKKIKKCNYCGQYKCIRRNICKKYQLFPTLIKYFGFNENVIGSLDIYKEFDKIKNIIEDVYITKINSIPDTMITFNYTPMDSANFYKIIKSLGIKCRSKSESISNAYLQGKCNNITQRLNYKSGWHTTWNGKKYFYRSSYELDYCKELDKQQIDYEMETLRILYWDSQQQKERVAIPDFYIPDQKLIVEIKSNYTYDEQNMKDKIEEYKKHGYNFKLILEHKEIKI